MNSYFLIALEAILALYSMVLFIKLLVQFGLPNHIGKFTAYFVTFSATLFFNLKLSANLNWVSVSVWEKWSILPLVAGSLMLLIQMILTAVSFSPIYQKVIVRLPLIGALLCIIMFPEGAFRFFIGAVSAGCILLIAAHGKVRYLARMYFKMSLFLILAGLMTYWQVKWLDHIFLFFAVFYFFILEQSLCITELVQEWKVAEGDRL